MIGRSRRDGSSARSCAATAVRRDGGPVRWRAGGADRRGGRGGPRGRPSYLHRMSERHIVVADLGYTPDPPVPRFRTPPASPAWRGSLVADSRSGPPASSI